MWMFGDVPCWRPGCEYGLPDIVLGDFQVATKNIMRDFFANLQWELGRPLNELLVYDYSYPVHSVTTIRSIPRNKKRVHRVSPMARLSGLQREVLSLYRQCLREVRKKPIVRGLFFGTWYMRWYALHVLVRVEWSAAHKYCCGCVSGGRRMRKPEEVEDDAILEFCRGREMVRLAWSDLRRLASGWIASDVL